MRISEFCGLTIADIDLEHHTLNIDKQLQRTSKMEYIIQPTKTNAGTRKLPITEDVAYCFEAIIQDRENPAVEKMVGGHTGFLFLDKDGMPEVAPLQPCGTAVQRYLPGADAQHHAPHLPTPLLLQYGEGRNEPEDAPVPYGAFGHISVTGGCTVILTNDYMPVVPVVIATGETTLRWSVDGETCMKTISAGTWEIPELELRHGDNSVSVVGEGITIFTYREGRL